MSPVPTAIQDQRSSRPVPLEPFHVDEQFLSLTKEVVVDWQMATDTERQG